MITYNITQATSGILDMSTAILPSLTYFPLQQYSLSDYSEITLQWLLENEESPEIALRNVDGRSLEGTYEGRRFIMDIDSGVYSVSYVGGGGAKQRLVGLVLNCRPSDVSVVHRANQFIIALDSITTEETLEVSKQLMAGYDRLLADTKHISSVLDRVRMSTYNAAMAMHNALKIK